MFPLSREPSADVLTAAWAASGGEILKTQGPVSGSRENPPNI